jgi:hypothetical protein
LKENAFHDIFTKSLLVISTSPNGASQGTGAEAGYPLAASVGGETPLETNENFYLAFFISSNYYYRYLGR